MGKLSLVTRREKSPGETTTEFWSEDFAGKFLGFAI
jgi:hypothetical protein